jgi:hypothetical protein
LQRCGRGLEGGSQANEPAKDFHAATMNSSDFRSISIK